MSATGFQRVRREAAAALAYDLAAEHGEAKVNGFFVAAYKVALPALSSASEAQAMVQALEAAIADGSFDDVEPVEIETDAVEGVAGETDGALGAGTQLNAGEGTPPADDGLDDLKMPALLDVAKAEGVEFKIGGKKVDLVAAVRAQRLGVAAAASVAAAAAGVAATAGATGDQDNG